MIFFLLTNVQMPTIVGILTFISRKNNIIGLSEPKKGEILISILISSPGRSPGRAIVLPAASASALAKSLN